MVTADRPADEELLELFGPAVKAANMQPAKRENSPYFGDVALTFKSDSFEMRLVSDQGLYSAEIRPVAPGTEWFDLSLLQMLLTGTDTLDGARIESQADFLREKVTAVRAALELDRWPMTRRQLQALERRRVARRFGPATEGG